LATSALPIAASAQQLRPAEMVRSRRTGMNSGVTPRITGWIARPLDRLPRAATFSAAYLFGYYAALAPPWRVDSHRIRRLQGLVTLSLGNGDNDRGEGCQGENARRGRHRPAYLPSRRQRPLSCTVCRLSLSL